MGQITRNLIAILVVVGVVTGCNKSDQAAADATKPAVASTATVPSETTRPDGNFLIGKAVGGKVLQYGTNVDKIIAIMKAENKDMGGSWTEFYEDKIVTVGVIPKIEFSSGKSVVTGADVVRYPEPVKYEMYKNEVQYVTAPLGCVQKESVLRTGPAEVDTQTVTWSGTCTADQRAALEYGSKTPKEKRIVLLGE